MEENTRISVRYDLYVITDDTLKQGLSHEEIARRALEGGADIIQLRDKHKEGRELFSIACSLRRITRQYRRVFIMNDRLDIALACEADGVHLGQEDLPLPAARKIVPRSFIIGISAGSPAEALAAERDGADYIGIGPVFPTRTKTDAGEAVGITMIQEIAGKITIPVVAIGGITLENAGSVIQSRAAGVAVISAIISSPDITGTTRLFREIIDAENRTFYTHPGL